MNQDFVDLLRAFADHEVENAARAHRALADFGAPLTELTEADLATPGVVFRIGVAPVRIDILTRIDGVSFDEAWEDKVAANIGGVPTFVLSRERPAARSRRRRAPRTRRRRLNVDYDSILFFIRCW